MSPTAESNHPRHETRRRRRHVAVDHADTNSLPFRLLRGKDLRGPMSGLLNVKLLGFLEAELDGWETRTDAGKRPGLAELSQLIRTNRKIVRTEPVRVRQSNRVECRPPPSNIY